MILDFISSEAFPALILPSESKEVQLVSCHRGYLLVDPQPRAQPGPAGAGLAAVPASRARGTVLRVESSREIPSNVNRSFTVTVLRL